MANIFSADPNCVALWRFENGALTTDTIGTNTLTDNNTVGTETSDYKEGAACADLEQNNTEYFSITDADLDSDFPLKNGDSTGKISVCGWVKFEDVSGHRAIFAKWDPGNNKRSIIFHENADSTNWRLAIGYDSGNSAENLYNTTTVQAGRWYHFGFTFDNSDKSWKMVIWDDTASSKVVNTSGTATNNINIEDATLTIGAWDTSGSALHDGLIDEIVVFKDILSTSEIDAIRGGTYTNNVEVLVSTATLTLTANAATIFAPTLVTASTATLALSTNSATVGLNQSITAITASLTLSTSAAIIEVDVVHVNAATATLTITPASATISYDVPVTATSQSLTITPYDAVVWDGAAWNAWVNANKNNLVKKYYCVLTGDADGTSDLILPMSSFQARRKSGEPTFLSCVIPGISYIESILERSNGKIQVYLAYEVAGVEQQREIIVEVYFEPLNFRFDQGGKNQSTTIQGHITESFTPKTIALENVSVYSVASGNKRFQCPSAMMNVNPGDTAEYGGIECTIGEIVYSISIGVQSMDIMEGASS